MKTEAKTNPAQQTRRAQHKIGEEFFNPGAALGGVQFRACETDSDLIAIQSMDNNKGEDEYRTHGFISLERWNEFVEDAGEDIGNPFNISRLCYELDWEKQAEPWEHYC